MFDLGATEILLIAIVAIIVIGPKDMPLALRTAGRWIGKLRRLSTHFRSGLDAMIREAEMEEMEKKWKAQNEKIMREHPLDAPAETEPTGALPSRPAQAEPAALAESKEAEPGTAGGEIPVRPAPGREAADTAASKPTPSPPPSGA